MKVLDDEAISSPKDCFAEFILMKEGLAMTVLVMFLIDHCEIRDDLHRFGKPIVKRGGKKLWKQNLIPESGYSDFLGRKK